ncbi:5-hydroxytryptamine receptor isoform X1 [Brachionus plicatilis]|uniref:5-hydroxytryptamine receptor isoform X1 n=1 Tax=Brachionus plicatilis TaxID=10195 RepID=A0A3M7QT37_BRAPC|nr:5-hydroxytryptamine receptor isoform X1 [Brachionus plicatilis]
MKKIISCIVLIVFISSEYGCLEHPDEASQEEKESFHKYPNHSVTSNNEKAPLFSLSACTKSLFRCIFLSTALGLLILFTIIGNSFVIAAVFLDRNLHNVANYLIVSLAFADLTVAVMVMPIGAYQEVFREWSLGKILCDIWTIFDVLCCTASILHLVAIALDRYWAITKFGYGSSRTPRLIFTFIAIIWSVSLVVAVSPHIFGLSYDVNNTDRCHLTDHLTYQLVSTVAAFYLPLIGMCVIYFKIFRTAKLRIRKKAFKNGSLLPKANKKLKSGTKFQPSNAKSSEQKCGDKKAENCGSEEEKSWKGYKWQARTTIQTDSVSKIRLDSHNDKPLYLNEDSSFYETKTVFASGEYDAMSSSLEYMPIRPSDKDERMNGDRLIKKNDTLEPKERDYMTKSDQLSSMLTKRAYIDLKRERKAAKTLGVIMSCFIVCWLPYFLMQIFFSVCKSCYLTRMLENSYIVTLLTWSGYLNSMLNPVIYTIFSPDFRNAFGKLLFGKFHL